MDIINYYYHWNELMPNEVNSWPLLTNGPFKLIFIIICYLSFAYFAPKLLKNHPPKDLRPWLVVQNGCTYGLLCTGTIILLTIINWGKGCFDCDLYEGFTLKIMRRIAYSYILSMSLRSIRLAFIVLRKKQSPIMPYALNDSFILLWVYYHLFYPSGNSILLVLLDLLFNIGGTTFLILSSPGKYFRPSFKWKKYILLGENVKFIMIIAHTLTINLQPTCNKFFFSSIASIVYGIIGIIFSRREYLNFINNNDKEIDVCKEKLS